MGCGLTHTTLKFLGYFLFLYTVTSSLPGSIMGTHSCQRGKNPMGTREWQAP